MSLEIRQQKSIYKPLSNHLKYIFQICFFQFWKVLKYDKPLSNHLRYVWIQIQYVKAKAILKATDRLPGGPGGAIP